MVDAANFCSSLLLLLAYIALNLRCNKSNYVSQKIIATFVFKICMIWQDGLQKTKQELNE